MGNCGCTELRSWDLFQLYRERKTSIVKKARLYFLNKRKVEAYRFQKGDTPQVFSVS